MNSYNTDMPPQEIDISYLSRSPSPSNSSSSPSSGSSIDGASSQSSQTSCSSPPPRWIDSDSVHVSVRPGNLQKASTFPGALTTSEPQWQHTHARRTSTNVPPPTLVRSTDVKGQFVNNLVGKDSLYPISKHPSNICYKASAKCMVEVIWPLAACDRHNLSLQTYIQEILKRTKTSFSTLQVALYYLLLIKAHVPGFDFSMEQPPDMAAVRGFQCGRRMFLASIILASKYLQDRNYSSKAWSKITSLPVEEINANEMAFLRAVQWKLHIPESKFNRWQSILVDYSKPAFMDYWKEAVKVLRPELDNLPPMSRPTIRTDFASLSSFSWPMTPSTPLTPTSEFSPSRVGTPAMPFDRPMSMQPPFAPRIERLLTPRLSEHSVSCQMPAIDSMRPFSAMSSAVSLSQNAAAVRSAADCRRLYSGMPAIIPPIRSISSSSSPESMISDHSSIASRSSSISSISLSSLGPPSRAAWFKSSTLTSSPEDIVIEEGSESPRYLSPQTVTKKRPAHWSVDITPIDVRVVDDSPAAASARSMLLSRLNARKVENVAPLSTLYSAPSVAHISSGFGLDARPASRMNVEAYHAAKRQCVGPKPMAYRIATPVGGPGMWSGIL